MKKSYLIILILFAITILLAADKNDSELNSWCLTGIRIWHIQPDSDSTTQDSLNKICAERGHILNFGFVTCLGWMPYYKDLPDKTLYINHDPNYMSGTCERCGKKISQPVQAKPDTVILWKKNNTEGK